MSHIRPVGTPNRNNDQMSALQYAIEHLQSMGIDTRPGTAARALVEVAIRAGSPLPPTLDPREAQGAEFAVIDESVARDLTPELIQEVRDRLARQNIRPDSPPGWTMHEDVGMAVVNPRAIQGHRVTVPEFEIVSNPTIRIDEVRNRRFDLIARDTYEDHPILLALLRSRARAAEARIVGFEKPVDSTKGPKRSIWEWLIDD